MTAGGVGPSPDSVHRMTSMAASRRDWSSSGIRSSNALTSRAERVSIIRNASRPASVSATTSLTRVRGRACCFRMIDSGATSNATRAAVRR